MLNELPPHLSVVVPLFDEEENIAPLCQAIRESLEAWGKSYEVLLVDDGSRDSTRERLQDQAQRDSRIRPVLLKRNSGQTLAMAAGFARARGQVIVSMDGDLQNDPRDIPKLLARLDQGFDVVCGWRKNRKDRWINRTLPSKIANWMIARLTGIPIHDNGCSLKAYRAEVIRSLNLYSEMHRFLPALSSMTGARIAEEVVSHHPRIHGVSKYGIARTFKVFSDMLAIKAITRFSQRPGLFFGLLSLPFLALGGLCAWVWGVGVWFDRGETIVFSSLAVMFLYLFGHMVALGVLGEVFLLYADHRLLRQLARVLSVAVRPSTDPERTR